MPLQPTSRLAPSPTGALHLGNARTFLVNWAMARQRGWRLLMRIEDLDGPRIKSDAAAQTIDTLRWLGLDWDDDVLVQSDDLSPYINAAESLCAAGSAFHCNLSRAEISAAASAPQQGVHETTFARHLRPAHAGEPCAFDEATANIRFLVPETTLSIEDGFCGTTQHDVAGCPGDFVIWTRRGCPAYQLAVVVDDARQGVTDVVRGDDLLASAARQELLARALDLPSPHWWHLPLVLGEDGHRLAKRHGDTRIDTYRTLGVPPERLLGLLACWCGLTERPQELTIAEVLERFDLDRLPRVPVTMTGEDDRWLRSV
ncbi:MAG: glutamate--tRNA ligase family protein [Phycisphaerales bacterium]|nr:glutamate--tRNA ligase family protein [Phycisphaerales bacterium]